MTAELNYGIGIDIVPNGAQAGANKVNAALDSIVRKGKTTSAANDNLSNTFDKIKKSSEGAAGSTKKIGSVLDEVKNKAAGSIPAVGGLLSKLAQFGPQGAAIAAIAIGLAAIGVAAVKAAAQVEVWKANLLTMTKSTTAADAAYRGLVDFANKTPFSLEQSVTGFTKLRALGLATSTDIMTSYGNTASAMGKNMSQMIEAVADATTGEFERLKEFGIKARTEGDKVSFTFQGVTKTVGKNSKEIQDYIVGIGKTNFGGAMARQMATASGAFANFSDQLFNTLAAMGDGILNKTVGKITSAVTSGLGAITPLLSGIMDVIGGILSAVWDVGAGILSMFTFGSQGASNFKSSLDNIAVAFSFVGEWVGVMGKLVGSVFSFIGDVIGSVLGLLQDGFSAVFNWLMPATASTGQSMGESLVGILRAGQFVAENLPIVFQTALSEIKMMFIQAGQALSASLTGDFSKWGEIDLSFKNTKKGAAAVWEGAKATYGDQKGNRAWIDNAAGKSDKGNIDFAGMGSDKPGPGKKGGSGSSAASEAQKKQKAAEEFWATLEGQVETAKLLPLAAADHAKELELQKILGRDLDIKEKERVVTLMQQVRSAQFMTDALDAHQQKALELGQQEELFGKTLRGMTEDQAKVEKEVYDFRNDALKEGVDLQSEAYKAAEAAVRADAARGVQLDKNNDLLKKGVDLFNDLNPKSAALAMSDKYQQQRDALGTAYNGGNNGGKYGLKDYERTLARINKNEAQERQKMDEELRNIAIDKWTGVINGLGDTFGGVFGKLANVFNDLAGSLKGESGIGGLMKSVGLKSPFDDTLKKWFGSSNTGLGKMFNGLFGKEGTLIKGLGDKLGAMGAGAQVGQMADGVLKGLGIKSSKTGAMLGGAAGSFLGPLGAIGGSILGGVVGGMFKKSKYATASLSMMAGGELGVGSLKGNSGQRKGIAGSAGDSVISGLEQLAASLGGSLTGTPSVSIGTYKDKWRVSTTGYEGKLKGGKNGVVDFGKDGAEEAIKFAIQDALKDGVITGISEFSKRVLSTMDIDKASSLATSYEGILKDLANFANPIKGAVDETVKSIDTLIEQMKKAGATTTELANVEQWRSMKLDEVLKDQLSSFQSVLDELNGEAGGFSSMSLLNKNLAEMEKFKTDIAAGKTVNQDDFANLMTKIIGGVNDIYGSNSAAGQGILTTVRDLTNSAMDIAKSEFNNASTKAPDTVAAIQSQTDTYSANQNVTNDYLRRLLEAVQANKGGFFGVGNAVAQAGNVNGKVTMAY